MVLDFSLLFGIPMAVGASVLGPQLLALLGRRYVVASEGLVILAFSSLVYTISAIIDQVLLGRERVDIEENRNLRRYLSSDLVFVPKVNLISSVVYVGLIYVLVATSGPSVPIDLTVAEWATAQLAVSSAVLVVKLIRVKRRENLQLSPSVLRYAIAAAIMGGVVYVMSQFLPSSSVGGIVSAIKLATIIFVGAAVYFSILILIDGQSRRLAAKFVKSL
jgi:O-antigen/teichoic acid export membrane protein